MAFWVVGGGTPPDEAHHPYDSGHHHSAEEETYVHGAKRRVVHRHQHHHHHYHHHELQQQRSDSPKRLRTNGDSVSIKNLAFLVIREGTPPPIPREGTPPRYRSPCPQPMERTASGLSISNADTLRDTTRPLLNELQAAHMVQKHTLLSRRDSQPSRILHSLIHPHSSFPLDNKALESLFHTANTLFFANRLSRRVTWDWSTTSSEQYTSHIVGTTALRHSQLLGGYETLIVLSSPILRDTRYNRRLLIATFLHEMIHSFLFVMCGVEAGGHGEAFRMIADVIDHWVGREELRLVDMEADLERFCEERGEQTGGGAWERYESEGFR